jgi:hypothetical protein
MHDHITLKLAAGFDLNLPILNAASDFPAGFDQKPRPDNETAFEATTDHRALSLHLPFARSSTAENKFPTFNASTVNDSLSDQCAA